MFFSCADSCVYFRCVLTFRHTGESKFIGSFSLKGKHLIVLDPNYLHVESD